MTDMLLQIGSHVALALSFYAVPCVARVVANLTSR